MKISTIKRLALILALLGFSMFVASLFYGNTLVAQGLPCDTNPFAVPLCSAVLVVLWLGAILLGLGFVLAMYLVAVILVRLYRAWRLRHPKRE